MANGHTFLWHFVYVNVDLRDGIRLSHKDDIPRDWILVRESAVATGNKESLPPEPTLWNGQLGPQAV